MMAAANELIMVFIGLEISSIASYVLAGYLRDDKRANEAALKYFLLGSFATAFLLYGVAWIYGVTGSTYLSDIRGRARRTGRIGLSQPLVAAAAALIFVGLAFKVSAGPSRSGRRMSTRARRRRSPAFLSAGPKAAAFAVFLRVFMTALRADQPTAGSRWCGSPRC